MCNKKNFRAGHLKSVQLQDSGEKQHKCWTCDKMFTHKSSMKLHIWPHTGEKQFVCTICNMSFFRGTNLDFHIRTHTRVKPYACTHCDLSFSQEGSLIEHNKNQSGEITSFTPCVKSLSKHLFIRSLTWNYTPAKSHSVVPYVKILLFSILLCPFTKEHKLGLDHTPALTAEIILTFWFNWRNIGK